jgi:hypothetical protein
MNIGQVREDLRANYLALRNLYRAIEGEDFSMAFEHASPLERERVLKAISIRDKYTLALFIKKQLAKLTPFHRMSVPTLRGIAKGNGLSNYSNWSKVKLIKEIENVVAKLKANSEKVLCQPQET